MNRIWKYPFPIDYTVTLQMPAGARVLSVQVQNGQPCLWAMVDPDAPKVERMFAVFGTGHPFPAELLGAHVGTIQMHEGSLVFHVFEAGRAA